jgi:S-adenosylmethionine-dependent methyltransferase
MPDDIHDIQQFYDSPESIAHEADRLLHHQLERDITLRYFETYLPSSGRIFEIGAATGAYTQWLSQRGYHVTAVDLSPGLQAEARRRILELGLQTHADFYLADARELSAVPGGDFDAVLLMGPMYHLVLEEDRAAALKQAVSRLRPGGLFISAWISRLGILGDLLHKVPAWIEEREEVRAIIEHGHDPEDYHRGGFRGYFARLSELVPFHEAAGLQTLVLAGVEPAISSDDESYNCLEGEQRRLWLDLLYEMSTERDLIASSRHLLYIGRRP